MPLLRWSLLWNASACCPPSATKLFCLLFSFWIKRSQAEIDSLTTVIHALVTSRADYCRVLYVGLPLKTVWKQQYGQHSAAGLLSGTGDQEHILPVNKHLPISKHKSICWHLPLKPHLTRNPNTWRNICSYMSFFSGILLQVPTEVRWGCDSKEWLLDCGASLVQIYFQGAPFKCQLFRHLSALSGFVETMVLVLFLSTTCNALLICCGKLFGN